MIKYKATSKVGLGGLLIKIGNKSYNLLANQTFEESDSSINNKLINIALAKNLIVICNIDENILKNDVKNRYCKVTNISDMLFNIGELGIKLKQNNYIISRTDISLLDSVKIAASIESVKIELINYLEKEIVSKDIENKEEKTTENETVIEQQNIVENKEVIVVDNHNAEDEQLTEDDKKEIEKLNEKLKENNLSVNHYTYDGVSVIKNSDQKLDQVMKKINAISPDNITNKSNLTSVDEILTKNTDVSQIPDNSNKKKRGRPKKVNPITPVGTVKEIDPVNISPDDLLPSISKVPLKTGDNDVEMNPITKDVIDIIKSS